VLEEKWRLDEGYRIDLFAEQETIGERDVAGLWAGEGVVAGDEAAKRLHEVLLVATTDAGELAGVSSAYLERNRQLGMDLWYYRTYVAAPHRMSNVAVTLALDGRDHLEQRFVSGADTRAGGILYEVENEGLKRYFDDAVWYPTDVIFIGENRRGDHVRVRYFPGTLAPEPPR
jgi:hypothetical protein